jgi:D-sedoheptulose 7-phosphate isomerase
MLGASLSASLYVHRLQTELARLDVRAMQRLGELLYRAWNEERFVFVFGNGGSATTASHISEDLGKSSLREADLLRGERKRVKVMSLTDNVGWIMALGNDLGYEHVFSQQLINFGNPGDLVIAVSGSGNSANVLTAVRWAKDNGLISFAFTGYDGGQLRRLADDGLHVALCDMGMVESIHLAAFHWVLNDVFARINGEGRYRETKSEEPAAFVDAAPADLEDIVRVPTPAEMVRSV